ncbi:Microcystinase C (MlrC) (Fragment) [Durusdinium trenchii]|uniref:Microcystinase C (MlrC) n=1 Tax=Durusdinium trenchii TaxID=1381693 RepID=A0ABP0SKQ7_9DINO
MRDDGGPGRVGASTEFAFREVYKPEYRNARGDRRLTARDFQRDLLVTGGAVRDAFRESHHEVGGFFHGASDEDCPDLPIEPVPIFAARTVPSGTITTKCWSDLIGMLQEALAAAGPLDGLLVAPHGATVSEAEPDADGHWLSVVREQVGADIPIIGTLDAHANLSPRMVDACNALVAYRSNPHLDQFARGVEAAHLMRATLAGRRTTDPHLARFYELADRQRTQPGILTNSLLLGFPYADVEEMGAATIAVTDGDSVGAQSAADELALDIWTHREEFIGQLVSVEEAMQRCRQVEGPVGLLDMGDNVGGGSAADGTVLAQALHAARIGSAFVCLYDPEAVKEIEVAGVAQQLALSVGGKTDDRHGEPLEVNVLVQSLHDGRFTESAVRHGGFRDFDQGRSAVVTAESGLTILVTSRRMVPFSLQQLLSCGLDPTSFRAIVMKGVHAPVAAYESVCSELIRVNTPGTTCADLSQLDFHDRRRPMFPWEPNTTWEPSIP